jgi:hypothetical protein
MPYVVRLRSIVVMLGVPAVALGCDAKEHAKDILREYGAGAPSAAAAPVAAPAPTPTASVASVTSAPVPSAVASVAPSAAAGAAAPASLADMFDGAAGDAVEKGKRVQATYGGRGTTIGVPPGWKAETENNAGLITLTSADGTASVFMHDYMGGVIDGSVNFWSNRAGFRHKAKVTWENPAQDGKYGPNHVDVKVGTGRGELLKKPATFFHVRLPKDILVAGALADEAPAERKQELLDAMKSLHPLEGKPKPEQ